MLESPQDESVVRWGNEGDSFVVLENEKFTKHILYARDKDEALVRYAHNTAGQSTSNTPTLPVSCGS